MDRDRAYFDRLYKWTFGAIAFVVTTVGAGFTMFGVNSVEAVQKRVDERIDTEFRTPRIQAIVEQIATEQAARRFEDAIISGPR